MTKHDDRYWDEIPPKPKQENTLETFLKKWIPEANPPQRKLLIDHVEGLIKNIIGDDIDTQALVRNRDRELAKYGFEINARLKEQRMRLNKAFGIPEPPEPDNRWWLKGHDHD